jgi:hypothetical protein
MIWDGWMSNDISLYSFCIRVPALSADLTNSKASKCSNAWNKNKKEKCDYRTIYLKSKFCCNLIFVLPVDTYGQLMRLGSLPVLSGVRVTQTLLILFLLAIVFSVLLWFMTSDYP